MSVLCGVSFLCVYLFIYLFVCLFVFIQAKKLKVMVKDTWLPCLHLLLKHSVYSKEFMTESDLRLIELDDKNKQIQ